ncbi:MAG: hypothetical protein NXI32_04095 [bacterium]|nr:hypothetical protein [bacterium]
MKPQPPELSDGWSWLVDAADGGDFPIVAENEVPADMPHHSGGLQQELWARVSCPLGVPGDRLWVRETWWRGGGPVAGGPSKNPNDGKVPSIFMPKWKSRITLEIVRVRLERLQDITEGDAVAEGCDINDPHITDMYPLAWFHDLWETINGKGSWDANPFVWALDFKRLL